MIYKQTKFVFFTRLSSTSMCPCSETLLTPGVMCKSCPLSTFRRQRVNLSAPFLWTRAKMWDLSESKHICPSPLLSYKRSEEANMYNARGRLQLMHLSCCQGGKKTPSQTSHLPHLPHLARQCVSCVRVSLLALSSQRCKCEAMVQHKLCKRCVCVC